MRPFVFGDGTREKLRRVSVAGCWVVKKSDDGDRIDVALCVFGIFPNLTCNSDQVAGVTIYFRVRPILLENPVDG